MINVPRARAVLAASCVLAAVLASSASATALHADARLAQPAVAAWMAERGLDASAVTVQSGSALYAGPNCPAGYSCVPVSGPVIQFVADGGVGIIDCDASSGCVSYQKSTSGHTVQNCRVIERGENLNQTCDATTDNVTGDSSVVIHMEAISRNPVTATGSITQFAQQSATCRMTNVTGRNTLLVRQLIDQFADINLNLPVQHKQQGNTTLSCKQVNGSGANDATVDIDHVLRSHAVGTTTTQQQNVDNVRPSVDLLVDQSQSSGGTGLADVDVDQTFDIDGLTPNGTSAMRQGPHDASGQIADVANAPLNAVILQNGGTSTFDADLTRAWTQAERRLVGAISSADNSQSNPIRCCLGLEDVQLSPDSATIDIVSTMVAPTDAAQRVRHTGRAKCNVACGYGSAINFDNEQVTKVTLSDKIVNNQRDCSHAAGQCGDGTPVNMITFTPGVRCEQPCGNEIYQKIDEGPDGARIGYRGRIQTFVPKGHSPISDLRLTLEVPQGVTVVKASGCQVANGTVSCKAGTGEQGGLRDVFMTFKVTSGATAGSEFVFVGTVYSGNNPNIEPVTRDATFRIV